VLAAIAALLEDGDVIAIDGKALRGARDKTESARTRMMVSAYAARLRLTLATVPADRGAELDTAIEALGLIALRGKVVTGDDEPCRAIGPCLTVPALFTDPASRRLRAVVAHDRACWRRRTARSTVVSGHGAHCWSVMSTCGMSFGASR
jgi:hypothetical protein